MPQSRAMPANAPWQAQEMLAVGSMDLDLLPDLSDLDASMLPEPHQSSWSSQQMLSEPLSSSWGSQQLQEDGQPGASLNLLSTPSRGLSQELEIMAWLRDLPSISSDILPLPFSHQQQEPLQSQPSVLQPSFPAAAFRPADQGSVALQMEQPPYSLRSRSCAAMQHAPAANNLGTRSSLQERRSFAPAAPLRPICSLPEPALYDFQVLPSRVLAPVEAVPESMRQPASASQAQGSIPREVPGSPPAFVIRGGLKAAAEAAAALSRTHRAQDQLCQGGEAPLLRYGRAITSSSELRQEGTTGWGRGVNLSSDEQEDGPPDPSLDCHRKGSPGSFQAKRQSPKSRKRGREVADDPVALLSPANVEQTSRRQEQALSSRRTISGDNYYRVVSSAYSRSFSAPDVTCCAPQTAAVAIGARQWQSASDSDQDPGAAVPPAGSTVQWAGQQEGATGVGKRQAMRSALAQEPSQDALLVPSDKLMRFATQLQNIRTKALVLEAEKQVVAQQAAHWQKRESHMTELVASLEQLSAEGAPLDAREERLKRGVTELSQMVRGSAPSADQGAEGPESNPGPSS